MVDLGACETHDGRRHVAWLKDGKPVSVGHASRAEEGMPLPPDADGIVWVDSKDGRIVDRMSLRGPAQVASPKYRDNYDAIFGAKKKPSKELN